jgi:hypothetical protein
MIQAPAWDQLFFFAAWSASIAACPAGNADRLASSGNGYDWLATIQYCNCVFFLSALLVVDQQCEKIVMWFKTVTQKQSYNAVIH